MDVCEHCKRWTSERDKACRLCRLCVALTQVSGQPGFTEEDYDRTAEQLASILGILTSKVLLAPVGGRSSFIAPRDTNTRGELPGSGEELRSQGSPGERTSKRRHSDRSRDRRRQRRAPTRSPKPEHSQPPQSHRRERRRHHSPSPREVSRDRKRERFSPKQEEKTPPHSEGLEKEPEKKEIKEEQPPDKKSGWVPQLRGKDSPSAPPPPPPKGSKEVILKGASSSARVPEPPSPPRSAEYKEKREDLGEEAKGAPSQPSSKGKGKGKYLGKNQKGYYKGKGWSYWGQQPWNWGWDSSWDYQYSSEGSKPKKNKGKARDQFIGKKIEERRAKAKAKGGGKPKEADEKEESDSSSVTAPPPRSEDLPPPGTVIAESTEGASGADQVAPERVENWADATEASTPGCSNTGQTEASQGA